MILGVVVLKRIILIILSMALLLPTVVFGEGMADSKWIVDKGYFGVGGLKLDKKMNRAELATMTIRMVGLESEAMKYKGKSSFTDVDNFQGKWATPYIQLAMENGLVNGKSKDIFNPGGTLTYTELLTVFMRVLGYEDGIDFIKYPDDYYKKALEIGLADMYISKNEQVLRETVLDTMVKTLNTMMKDKDYSLFHSLTSAPKEETPIVDITIKDLKFNLLITGIFSGELKGTDDFTGYKVILLSNNGMIYESKVLGKAGSFVFDSFDIGILAKLTGYKYEVYNKEGKLLIESKLQ